jgi:hypothetical protein
MKDGFIYYIEIRFDKLLKQEAKEHFTTKSRLLNGILEEHFKDYELEESE